MKIKIFLLLFFPMIFFGQSNEEDCFVKYEIYLKKYSGLFMCPYLVPKMTKELNKIDVCVIHKDEENLFITFDIDTLYTNQFIENIFLKEIGIPEWSILDIKID